MNAIKSLLLSPLVRFFTSVAAGTVGQILVIVVLALALAHTFPPATLLVHMIPLCLFMGMLAAGAWCMTVSESKGTAWILASTVPAGMLFVVEYLTDAARFGPSHIDGMLLLFMAAWGLAGGLATAAASHGLLNLVERRDATKNKPNSDR